MTGEAFYHLFVTDIDLRQKLMDYSHTFSYSRHMTNLWQDFYQEAWARILERCEPGMTTEYYVHQGILAMRAFYRKERKQLRLYESRDAYVRRIKRRAIKIGMVKK